MNCKKVFNKTSYVKNLFSNLPKEYEIISLDKNPYWLPQLEVLCEEIVVTGNDRMSSNYSNRRFKIDEQMDVTLLVSDNKILAFSSLWKAAHFPKGFARVLNRTWKSPLIRSKVVYKYKLLQIFLSLQIKAAFEDKDINCIFSSMEGLRTGWWKKWISEIDKIHKGWKLHPEMVKVCRGTYSKCWQSFIYLDQKNREPSELPFSSISKKCWKTQTQQAFLKDSRSSKEEIKNER